MEDSVASTSPKSETCRCCKSNIDPPHALLAVRIWRVATGWCTLAVVVGACKMMSLEEPFGDDQSIDIIRQEK